MQHRLKRVMLSALVAALGAQCLVVDAQARPAVTVRGVTSFDAAASLPVGPCRAPEPSDDDMCNGTFRGDWSGALSGVVGTSPFEVAWSTNGDRGFDVRTFEYETWPCDRGIGVVPATARGSGSAFAGPGQIDGNWQVLGELFARDVLALELTFDFQWKRLTDTTATITLDPVALRLHVNGIGWVKVLASPQAGTVEFVPLPSDGGRACTERTTLAGLMMGELALHEGS
jgi:hypothetical protein